MKTKLLLIFIFLLIPLFVINPQENRKNKKSNKKLEELEKNKIIEIIQLDENAVNDFFSKRELHKKKMKELNQRLEENFKALEDFNNEKNKNSSLTKEILDSHFAINEDIFLERRSYFNYLKETLSDKVLIKLIVFEKKFRDEVRNALYKSRTRKK